MCFRTRVRLPPSPPSDPASPSPGGAGSVCALRVRSRTGRRATARDQQFGGLLVSPRADSRHLHHVVASVISLAATFFAKVTSRSFCCASFSPQNLAARFFAGAPFSVSRQGAFTWRSFHRGPLPAFLSLNFKKALKHKLCFGIMA